MVEAPLRYVGNTREKKTEPGDQGEVHVGSGAEAEL